MAMGMPKDRYFFIQNPASGLVLEVDKDRFVKTGHQISSFSKNQCQLWYIDNLAIRNKANTLCLDASTANAIKTERSDPASERQKWVLPDKQLHLQCDSESAISISGKGEPLRAGCDILLERQGHKLEFVYTSRERRLFYIVNSATEDVMDVARSDSYQGAQVITFPRSHPPRNNQLWYHGEHGSIHSRLNDSVLTEKDAVIVLCAHDPTTDGQKWNLDTNRHICKTSSVSHVLGTREPSWFQIMNRLTEVVVVSLEQENVKPQEWSFEYLKDQDVALSHSGTGKFAFIRSFKYPTLVFSLENGKQDRGTAVVLAEPDPGHSGGRSLSHLWHLDDETDTVRSAANDYCLDALVGNVVINPYVHDSHTQKWRYTSEDKKLRKPGDGLVFQIPIGFSDSDDRMMRKTPFKSISLKKNIVIVRFSRLPCTSQVDGDFKPSTGITTAHDNKNPAQMFVINHVQAVYFYIRNDFTGKVMEVERGNKDAETAVVLATQVAGYSQQLWYEDERGLIRSALNGYAFSGKDGDYLKMMPLNPSIDKHQWSFHEDIIRNRIEINIVADIYDGGVRICAWEHHGKRNQLWRKLEPTPSN